MIRQFAGVDWLAHVGLGLDNDSLLLEPTTAASVDAGVRLRREVADRLAGLAAGVEQIGSSSVVQLRTTEGSPSPQPRNPSTSPVEWWGVGGLP